MKCIGMYVNKRAASCFLYDEKPDLLTNGAAHVLAFAAGQQRAHELAFSIDAPFRGRLDPNLKLCKAKNTPVLPARMTRSFAYSQVVVEGTTMGTSGCASTIYTETSSVSTSPGLGESSNNGGPTGCTSSNGGPGKGGGRFLEAIWHEVTVLRWD